MPIVASSYKELGHIANNNGLELMYYSGYNYLLILKDSNGLYYGSSQNTLDPRFIACGLTMNSFSIPERIPFLDDCVKFILNDYEFIVEKSDGTVWFCGYNYFYLNNPSEVTTPITSFTQIAGVTSPRKISCKHGVLFIEKLDGTVWACGLNDRGQLGLGDKINRYSLVQVTNITNPNKIICGDGNVFIEKSDGTVVVSGVMFWTEYTSFDFTVSEVSNPKRMWIGGSSMFFEYQDGTIHMIGTDYGLTLLDDHSGHFSPVQIPGLLNIIDMYIEAMGVYVITNDGTLMYAGPQNMMSGGDYLLQPAHY